MEWTSRELAATIAACAAAYLCGSVPFGLLVGRARGLDIRAHGSGNIGATNVGRVLGRPWGVLVFVLDVLKGLLPTAAFGVLLRSWTGPAATHEAGAFLAWLAVGVAGVLGHTFPVYIGFRGGKAVATSLGVALGVWPYFTLPALAAGVVWVGATLLSRYVSVGSVAAAGAFPVLFAVLAAVRAEYWGSPRQLWPMYVFAVAVAGLIILRHRGNLARLWQGTEPRIGGRKGSARTGQDQTGTSREPG